MKIAITATEERLDAEIDPFFGRAKYFAIYETDDGSVEFISNAINRNVPRNAGIQTAANLVQAGVEVVITGKCGPRAYLALTTSGAKVVTDASGTVKQVAEKFKLGEYEYTTVANADAEGY